MKNLFLILIVLLAAQTGFGQENKKIRLYCEFGDISNDTIDIDSVNKNTCVSLKYDNISNTPSKIEQANSFIIEDFENFNFNDYEIDKVIISSLICIGGIKNLELENNCIDDYASIFFQKPIAKNRLYFEVSIKKYDRTLKKKLIFSIWTK